MNVHVGLEIPAWDMPRVLPERMRTMAAILRDPYPVHWDRRIVAKMGLGERTINQGPLGLSYMINMLHAWAGHESIKSLKMTFPLPVFEGDHVVAKGIVTAIKTESTSDYVDCDIWLERNDDQPLVGTATVLIPNSTEV